MFPCLKKIMIKIIQTQHKQYIAKTYDNRKNTICRRIYELR